MERMTTPVQHPTGLTITSPSVIRDIAEAASEVRISWLAGTSGGLPRDKIKGYFLAAAELIPVDILDFRLTDARASLYAIHEGVDPRNGPFKAQAIAASAKLHTLLADLVMEATK